MSLNFDDDAFQEWRRKRYGEDFRPATAGPSGSNPLSPKTSVLGDLLLSVPRGIEGAVQDVYGLVDTIAFDALPDYNERFLGESKTVVGSLAEGVTSFLTGFIPIAGAIGKVGRVGRALRLTKATAEGVRLTLAGEAVAGAITDLAVFGGREERLSNLIQQFPSLQNPITEFLAAGEKDGEIEGRIKNVLEGLALGAMTEPFIAGLRLLKRQRVGLEKFKTAKEVEDYILGGEELSQLKGSLQFRWTGNDAERIIRRLETDANFGKLSDPQEVATIREFINRVGHQLFEGVKLRTTLQQEGSSYDLLDEVITLGARAIRGGELEQNTLHEFWHHLSRFVDEDVVSNVEKLYRKDLQAAVRRDPTILERLENLREQQSGVQPSTNAGRVTEGEYRYLSLDEWWAEVMTEKTLKRLDEIDEASMPGVRGLIAHSRMWLQEVIAAFKAKFGINRVDKAFNDFFAGKGDVSLKSDLSLEGRPGSFLHSYSVESPTTEGILRSIGIDEEKARQIADEVKGRLDAGIDPQVNPRKLDPEWRLTYALEKHDLNLSRWLGSPEGLTLTRVMEDLYHSVRSQGPNRPKAWTEQDRAVATQAAEVVGLSPDDYMARLEATRGSLDKAISAVHAHSRMVLTLGEELKGLAEKVRSGNGTDQDAALLARNLERYGVVLDQVKGLRGEVGRGLGYMRRPVVPIEDIAGSPELIREALSAHGGKERIIKLADQIAAAFGEGGVSGTKAVADLAKFSAYRRGVNLHNEIFVNSILSGPKTLGVNNTSGLMMSLYLPFELALGAGVRTLLGRQGAGSLVGDAFREVFHLADSIQEAAKLSWRAFKEGEGVLTSRFTVDTPLKDRNAFTAQNLGLNPSSVAGAAVDWFGHNLVRLPTRLMAGADEFIKQINYRAVAKADLWKQGVAAGKSGKALADHIQQGLDKLIFDGQAYSTEQLYNRGLKSAQTRGLNEDEARKYAAEFVNTTKDTPEHERLSALGATALRRAEEATFTTKLPYDSISGRIEQLVVHHPLLRGTILPFVRTPVNILKFSAQRLDATGFARGLFAQRFPAYAKKLETSKARMVQDLLSKDPRRVAEAYGRFTAGLGFTATGMMLASQGVLTGRGPSDPERRKALEASGWLPYSIFDGERYWQYQRADPYATLFGLWADMFDYFKHANPSSHDETLAYALGTALANNFTNKSYLTGLRNFFDAITEPDRFVPRWLQRQAGAYIPNIAGQAVGAFDDDMREVRSILDALFAKVPGLAEGLAPQRNVLGETVKRISYVGDDITSWANWWSPLAYRDVSDDKIAKELAALGHGWTPPKTIQSGIELVDYKSSKGQDAYDRWGELQGSVKIGKRTLRQSLTALIDSQRYQAMDPTPDYVGESPRVAEIQKLINRYRRAAFRQLRKEFPDIVRAEEELRKQRLAAKYPSARQILEQ